MQKSVSFFSLTGHTGGCMDDILCADPLLGNQFESIWIQQVVGHNLLM